MPDHATGETSTDLSEWAPTDKPIYNIMGCTRRRGHQTRGLPGEALPSHGGEPCRTSAL